MSLAGNLAPSAALTARWAALPLDRRNAFAILAITILALVWQTRWGTIPDTSWLITVSERMLGGERLYAEIYETNPPFTVWLYLAPVAVARWLGVAPEIVVHAWTYLAGLAGLMLAGVVLRRSDIAERDRLIAWAPAVWAMLVIYPGNAFTEREHIGVALFLPLMVLMAWRAKLDGAPPSRGLAVLVGLAGSVLLLIKPHYAVMVLAPALWICWLRRSPMPLFAIEHWVIAIVCSAYLATVIVVYPEFLRDIYPMLADVYARIRTFLPILLQFGLIWAVLMFLCWRLWPRRRTPELAGVFVIASIAGMLPLFVQAKGWTYHAYPTLFCAVMALIALRALPGERRGEAWKGPVAMMMNPSGAIVLAAVIASFSPYWVNQRPSANIVAAIRSATDRPSVALVGTDLANGHPLVRMVDGRWASTHVSDWLGVFALYLSVHAQLDGNIDEAARYAAIADNYAAEKRGELLRRRPDIISVQKDEEFWTDYLARRHGFDAIFADYRLLVEDDEVGIYLREDYVTASAAEARLSAPE